MIEIGVTEYAINVLLGNRIAGKTVKKACKRHLQDLKQSANEDYPYYFDEQKALRALLFAESLTFTDGKKAGQKVELADFQKFIICSIFGWCRKKDGYRRFNKAYIQLARKQAKTYLVCMIALYMAEFAGYENAQIYTTATASKQSFICFKNVRDFINKDKILKNRIKSISERDMKITFKSGASIQSLSGNTGNIDGFMPYLGVVDEYHAHSSNQMVKLLEDGQVQFDEALMLIITTAGFNVNSSCYQEYKYCKKILNNEIIQDNYFIFIAELDEEDDVWEEENWYKANPLAYYVPKIIENLGKFSKEAKHKNAEDIRNYKVKSMNKWLPYSELKYINALNLEKCETDLTLEDFRGESCVIGIDLSQGGDLTSIGVVPFKWLNNGDITYHLHQHSFMPKGRLQEHIDTDKVPYDEYIDRGYLTLTQTESKVDYTYVAQYIRDIEEKYNLDIVAICYDPYKMGELSNKLDKLGYENIISINQGWKQMYEPIIFMRGLIDDIKVSYNKDDELLKWSLLNAEIIEKFGWIKIDKEKRTNRIDIVDALLNAFKYLCTLDEDNFNQEKFNENLINELYNFD